MFARNLGLAVSIALAWDSDGQGAIGMTCMSGIKSNAISRLKKLLAGKDIVDVAHWSYQLVQKYPPMEALYYQVQDRDLNAGIVNCEYFNARDNCREGNCLVGALDYYYHKLMTGESAPGFTPPVALKLSDTDLLKLITSLIGELHSFSRFGYTADRSGKDTVIEYIDVNRKQKTTLFDYWDHDIIQRVIRDRPHFWFSGWTHVQHLSRHVMESEKKLWESMQNKTEIFEMWARSTFKASCSRVYRDKSKVHMYSAYKGQSDLPVIQGKNGTVESHLAVIKTRVIPATSVHTDFEMIKQKILLAGLRMSFVVNHILETKDVKKLRTGSHVGLPHKNAPSLSAGNAWSDQRAGVSWGSNLITNICIIGVVLAAFLALLNFTGEKPIQHAEVKSKE